MDVKTAARTTYDNLTDIERTLLADLDKLRYLANSDRGGPIIAAGLHAYQTRTYGAIEAALVETLKTAIEAHNPGVLASDAKSLAGDLVGEMTRSGISAVEVLDYAAETAVAW